MIDSTTWLGGFAAVILRGMAKVMARTEPRWPAAMALLAVGGLRLALPERLSAGPGWLLLVVVVVLLVPTIWARVGGSHRLNQVLGTAVNGVVTA
ncbi:MAG TPA: hypothetical protein VKV02_14350, partial [Acidobacteriaceae bacterium]|nr:hypothetical protein [Acidobacteriaceae bacterium]